MKQIKVDEATYIKSLNPFEFRAGLKLLPPSSQRPLMRLNPFEFRAGLKLKMGKISFNATSLNPFEFRAGLKPHGFLHAGAD